MPGLKEGPFGRPPPRAIEDSGKGAVFPSAPPDFSALARLPDSPLNHTTGEGLEEILSRLLGVLQRHPEPRYKSRTVEVLTPSGLAMGADVLGSDGLAPAIQELRFDARSIIVDNPTGYTLRIDGLDRFVPPTCFGFIVRCNPTLPRLRIVVKSGTQAAADYILVKATEEPLEESGGSSSSGGGSVSISGSLPAGENIIGAVNVVGSTDLNELVVDSNGQVGVNNFPATQPVSAVAGAITDLAHGQGTMAQSVPVVIASNQSALAVTPGNQSAGSQANLWNNAATGAAGNSLAGQLPNQHYAALFGHASAATTMSLQYSADNINFYTVATSVLAAASDFGFTNLIVPAGIYMRLQSSANVTATATLMGSA